MLEQQIKNTRFSYRKNVSFPICIFVFIMYVSTKKNEIRKKYRNTKK